VFSLRDGTQEVIKHFEVILFWEVAVISMAAMIKLRHQQPSLWHRGLAEDIEGLWEPWMRLVDEPAHRRAASGHGARSHGTKRVYSLAPSGTWGRAARGRSDKDRSH
jgi:hypothetical protein